MIRLQRSCCWGQGQTLDRLWKPTDSTMVEERDTVRLTWATYNYQSPLRLSATAILIHWLVKSAVSKKQTNKQTQRIVELKQSCNVLTFKNRASYI